MTRRKSVAIDQERISSIVESLIFVSETPLSFRKIRSILEGVPPKQLQEVIDGLIARYRAEGRGVIIEEVADGYQMRTPPENQEWVKMLIEYKPIRLSRAALETLAIIAYQQPTTKTEVEAIRGVDSSSAVARLLELDLVKILGRKEVPGRPFIYASTLAFLEVFNLGTLGDLPNLQEIEDLAPEEIEAFSDKLAEFAGEKVDQVEEEEGAAADTAPATEEPMNTADTAPAIKEPMNAEDAGPDDAPDENNNDTDADENDDEQS
jgi:segregation and condensation protein B